VNLTRYHGVFAPNHRLRAQIVPGQRGGGESAGQGSAVPKRAAMSWAQRLKRVFGTTKRQERFCLRSFTDNAGPLV
jgi:hypothetical protein